MFRQLQDAASRRQQPVPFVQTFVNPAREPSTRKASRALHVILRAANPFAPQERTLPIEHDPRRTTTPAPRFAPAPAADALAAMRAAGMVIQVASLAIVLAALPYPIFQLDRYTFPKELVLGVAALAASLLCLSSARRLTVFMVDVLLGGFLVLSLASTLLATNGWLAFRALGLSLAGAGLFWCARTIARSGRGEALLLALAAAVVLGSVTGLAQAYGLVETNLASLTRAPGGTFGNRNFMAHLAAMGLPLLLYVSVASRSKGGRRSLMIGSERRA